MQKILNFIIDHWYGELGLGAFIYELLASLVKTKKNLSILDNVFKLIRFLIPNRSSGSKQIISFGKDEDPEITSKHIVKIIALVLLSSFAYAQPGTTSTKGTHYVNVLDSTTMFSVNGTIYYNEDTRSGLPPHFMVYENNVWRPLFGSSFALTNGNGTTASGTAVNWGGPLTQNTTIDGDAHNFTFFDLGLTQWINTSGNMLFQTTNGNSITHNAGSGSYLVIADNGAIGFDLNAGSGTMSINAGLAHLAYTDVGSTNSSLLFNDALASDFTIRGSDGTPGSISGDLLITTGDSPGPGAQRSGMLRLTTGLAFGDKPGDILISAGQNTTGDDSGNVVLSAAQYTGDSTTVTARSDGTIEMRTHGDVVIRPNSLTSNTTLTLEDTRLQTNQIAGSATLIAGTATVTVDVFPSTRVFLSYETISGTPGFLSIANVGAGTFDIVSTSGTDTSTVSWFLVDTF